MKSISTHEQFSVALGEEAVGVLAGIAFKLLNCMRADNNEPSTGSREQHTPGAPESFMALSTSVLKCCGALLVRIVLTE